MNINQSFSTKIIALLSLFVLLACTDNNAKKKPDNILRTALPNSSGQFNPLYIFNVFDRATTDLIYENLTTRDKNNQLIFKLAKDITNLETNRVYRVEIERDHFFSDGSEVLASDVVNTYNLLANKDYIGPYQKHVINIKGYEDYNSGLTNFLEGVKLIDEYSFEIEFDKALLKNYELFTFPVFKASSFTASMLKDGLKQPMPLGSNYYKIESYEPSQKITLVRNEYMASKINKSNIEKIEIVLVSSPNDMLMLLNGEIDFISGISEESKIDEVNKKDFLRKASYTRSGYTSLIFNTTKEPTSDVNVRQALRYAFNRKLFLDSYLGKLAIELAVPTNPVWSFYDNVVARLDKYEYNKEKASAILDSAGYKLADDGYRYKDGKLLEVVWVLAKNSKAVDYLVPILSANYKDVGVKLFVKTLDQISFYDELYVKQTGYNMVMESIFEEWEAYGSADRYLAKNAFNGGQNISHLNDESNEVLIRLMDESKNEKEFYDNYKNWLENINKLSPVMVLYGNKFADVYNRRVKNLESSSLYTWRMQVGNLVLE